MSGFCMILKHSGSFMFTLGIGTVFNFLGKLSVCVGNVVVGYCILKFWPEIYNEINSPIGPLAIVFLFTFVVTTLFMGMYTTTATALLHCLFADVDMCKQRDIDFMVGTNRPKEMAGIVRALAKPKKVGALAPSSDGGSP